MGSGENGESRRAAPLRLGLVGCGGISVRHLASSSAIRQRPIGKGAAADAGFGGALLGTARKKRGAGMSPGGHGRPGEGP